MKKAIIAISILICTLAGLIIYEAMNINKIDDFNIKLMPTKECDLQLAKCSFEVPNLGEASFSINPKPIKMNTKLALKVETKFKDDVGIWIDFLGVEMDMGLNRNPLKQSGMIYTGEGFLPTCSQNQMHWKSTVLIKVNDLTYGYVFKFLTKKNDEE